MKKNVLIMFGFLIIGCSPSEDAWTSLFNGEDLEGWHVFGAGDDYNGWTVEEGILVYDPLLRKNPRSSDLVSDQKFTSFELSLEWMIADYGNSGVFWGVAEDDRFAHAYLTGAEIQILDDNWTEYIQQRGDITRAGSLYGLMAPTAVVSKTGGAWNHFLLHIDHAENIGYLIFNDQEVLRFPVNGPAWEEMVNESGFADWPDFAKTQTGHICLQEYGGRISFRNIKIRELPADSN